MAVDKAKPLSFSTTIRNPERIPKSEDETFSDKQLEKIIEMSPQKHKEAGFEYGWDSRFDTWYKMIKKYKQCS